MTETGFIQHYIANASQMMWFLGAGTSRTAGMPTAMDIIWDLKLGYYCREENQDIKTHDINNERIKTRIQAYMDSKGFPALWSPEEYTFYFELTFGTDYLAQQKYLAQQLHRDKISLNTGHRALAGLIALKLARIVFTTNFDEVIETACVKVGGEVIPTFHLEGSYAAINALNAEQFPFYAKIHGDFKYQSIKNLAADLVSNDREIQRCLIAAAARYGMIVSGYSGRDANVMSMLREAVEQHNAFPAGLFWTVTNIKKVEPVVTEFISFAVSKGINAHVIEAGTFDSMLSKIWRQLPGRTDALNKKVNTASTLEVNIPLDAPGTGFPVIRLNALPITSLPGQSALIKTKKELSAGEVKDLLIKNKSKAIITRGEHLLAWGDETSIRKALGDDIITEISNHTIEKPEELISSITAYYAFFERAIAVALCDGRPIQLKNTKGFMLAVDPANQQNNLFEPLRKALTDRNGHPGILTGTIPGAPAGTSWTEALRIKLEVRNGEAYLLIRPAIWIEPFQERRNQQEFIKGKRRTRYNQPASKILDAWITILLGAVGKGEVDLIFQKDAKYPARFKISTQTSFSRK